MRTDTTEVKLVNALEAALERARQRADEIENDPKWRRYEESLREQIRRARIVIKRFNNPDSVNEDYEEIESWGMSIDEAYMVLERFKPILDAQAAERNRELMEVSRAIRNGERALSRLERCATESERLELLLRVAASLDSYLTAAQQRIVESARERLENLKKHPTDQQPTVDATETAGEEKTILVDIYLPKPAPLEFDDADLLIVRRLEQGVFDDLKDYQLNQRALELSLMTGFEQLLCLEHVQNLVQYPFQIDTARQVLRRFRGRALLCDEVGLGKTIEAGLVLKEYILRRLVRRVLILTPPPLVSQWREEMLEKFQLEFVTHEDPQFTMLGTQAWSQHDRIIASLHTAKLMRHCDAIAQLEWDMVIVDEAHHLKNRSTANWKLVNRLKKKYILLLTATPVQNDLDELFNLITLLLPGQLKTQQEFRREFVQRGDPRTPKNRSKLRELLLDVMVRNTRSQVNISLPPRRAQTVSVKLSAPEAQLYDAVTKFIREEFGSKGHERMVARLLQEEVGSSPHSVVPTLESLRDRDRYKHLKQTLNELCELARSASESAKGQALLSLLRSYPDKLLIFTKYRETQRFILKLLNEAAISAAQFSGDLSASEKNEQVARFAGECKVMVSTDVGSEGRNLQFCHAMLNYDLPWNPMRIEQRVGRIHRIGQSKEVHIFNLSAQDTIESYILKVLDEKINMFELVVGEIGMILGHLDEEREFEDIVLDIWLQSDSKQKAEQVFEQLGEQLVQAHQEYVRTKEYDDALFGEEFAAEG